MKYRDRMAQQAHCDVEPESDYRCVMCDKEFSATFESPFRPQQAHEGGPDYRCVMCDKPIPVGCADCTEYAFGAVGPPQQAQPEDECALADALDDIAQPSVSTINESNRQVIRRAAAVLRGAKSEYAVHEAWCDGRHLHDSDGTWECMASTWRVTPDQQAQPEIRKYKCAHSPRKDEYAPCPHGCNDGAQPVSDTQDNALAKECIALVDGTLDGGEWTDRAEKLLVRAAARLRSHPRAQDDARDFDAWFRANYEDHAVRQSSDRDFARAAWNAARRVAQPTREQAEALAADLRARGARRRTKHGSLEALWAYENAADAVLALYDAAPRERTCKHGEIEGHRIRKEGSWELDWCDGPAQENDHE